MSNEVQTAIGTQRQFAKQPVKPYGLQLNRPNFSAGISQRTDYDAQRLSSALGLLGDKLMAEYAANEKREQEQATLVNADKLLAGKTKEDLKKFDRMAALQNTTNEFDLTDNKYAMAVLEKGIGKMASAYAKQQWANDPDAQKPKSVNEAIGLFQQYLKDNREQFDDGTIQNTTAFEQGYYEGAMQDTIKVAEEADARINDKNRQRMVMLGSSHIQDVVSSNLQGEELNTAMLEGLRMIQLGTKDPKGFAAAIIPLAQMMCEKAYTTNQLDTLLDYEYEDGLKVRDMFNSFPYYEKIAGNMNYQIADDIYSKCTRPDGTLDLEKAYKEMENIPAEIAKGSGIPEYKLPISGSDNPDIANITPELKGALGCVGGVLYQMGFTDAQLTSGYRSAERNAAVNGSPTSHHLQGNAVDIWLGERGLSSEEQDDLKSYFGQYFGEVLFHNAGSGEHLHLADYKGGMKAANPTERTAAAYSPQRQQDISKILLARHNQAVRVNKQKLNDLREETTLGVMGASSEEEATQIIQNSGLPARERKAMLNSVQRKFKKSATLDPNTADYDQLWCVNYETKTGKDSLAQDSQTIAAWRKASNDPDFDDHPEWYNAKDWDDLQEKANLAASRMNHYWVVSSGGNYKVDKPKTQQSGKTQQTEQSAWDKLLKSHDIGSVKTFQEPRKLSDNELAELRAYVLSNPVNEKTGEPLSPEQIQEKLEQLAKEANLDWTEVVSILNDLNAKTQTKMD